MWVCRWELCAKPLLHLGHLKGLCRRGLLGQGPSELSLRSPEAREGCPHGPLMCQNLLLFHVLSICQKKENSAVTSPTEQPDLPELLLPRESLAAGTKYPRGGHQAPGVPRTQDLSPGGSALPSLGAWDMGEEGQSSLRLTRGW